jgi:ligand-binding SRPBCC domain-containing protein
VVKQLVFESVVPCTVEELWAFHDSLEALKLLTPPTKQVEIIGDTTELRNGAVHKIRAKQFGVWLEWHAKISQVEPPSQFVDTAIRSPFKFWEHRHEFLPHAHGTLLKDTVRYEMPFGILGRLVDSMAVRRDLERMFEHRHRVTVKHFEKD